MATFIRKFSKRIAVAANIVLSLLMLLLYLLPAANLEWFWFLNLLALLFPYLLVLQIGFVVFWLLAKPRLVLLPVLSLLLCWGLVRNVVAFSPGNGTTADNALFRVATWNMQLVNFYGKNGNADGSMLQQAKQLGADVLAVQELVFSLDSNSNMSLQQLKKRMGFRYAVAANDRGFGVHTNNGMHNERYYPFCVALFSNFPILRWEKVQSLKEYNHTFLVADVLVGADTIRFFNIHLQSMHFARKDYDFIEHIDQQDMATVKRNSKTILHKMKAANLMRALQVKLVAEELAKSPYPVILCGDFNDVPNSFAYQTLSSQLKDAFLEQGSGLGRTFRFLAPTLRIDYLLYDERLQLQSFRQVPYTSSDHVALVAAFGQRSK